MTEILHHLKEIANNPKDTTFFIPMVLTDDLMDITSPTEQEETAPGTRFSTLVAMTIGKSVICIQFDNMNWFQDHNRIFE